MWFSSPDFFPSIPLLPKSFIRPYSDTVPQTSYLVKCCLLIDFPSVKLEYSKKIRTVVVHNWIFLPWSGLPDFISTHTLGIILSSSSANCALRSVKQSNCCIEEASNVLWQRINEAFIALKHHQFSIRCILFPVSYFSPLSSNRNPNGKTKLAFCSSIAWHIQWHACKCMCLCVLSKQNFI